MSSLRNQYNRVAFFLLSLVALVLGTLIALPFVPAILWATVLSVLLYPVYVQWRGWLNKRKWLQGDRAAAAAALFTTLVALVIIVIPFLLIGGAMYQQIQSIADEIGANSGVGRHALSVDAILRYVDDLVKPLAQRFGAANFSLIDYVREHRQQIVENLRLPVTKAASQVVFTMLTLVIALLTMFFMLRDGERAEEAVLDLLPLPSDKGQSMLQKVAETIRAVFIGTVLVAILQGTIMGVTYAIIGVPNSLLLGVFSVLLCIIPLLGAPVLYIPIGMVLLAQGQYTQGAVILAVGGLLVSQIDNFLKPIFIAGRANIHPMLIFFAILGGVVLIGPIGVMAGPMLLTVILSLADVVRERIKLDESPVTTS